VVGGDFYSCCTSVSAFLQSSTLLLVFFAKKAIELGQMDLDSCMYNEFQSRQDFAARLQQLFKFLDTDFSGKLSQAEFAYYFANEHIKAYLSALGLEFHDVDSFFTLLDSEGLGEVSMNSFVQGCVNLRGAARGIEVAKMAQETHSELMRLRKLVSRLNARSLDSDKDQCSGAEANTENEVDGCGKNELVPEESTGLLEDFDSEMSFESRIVYVCKSAFVEIKKSLQQEHEVTWAQMDDLLEPKSDYDIVVPVKMNADSLKTVWEMMDQLGPTRAARIVLRDCIDKTEDNIPTPEITALRCSLRQMGGPFRDYEQVATLCQTQSRDHINE